MKLLDLDPKRSQTLLALDPGLGCVGYALFELGVLTACGLSRTHVRVKDLNVRVATHAANLLPMLLKVDRVVCERMVWRGRSAKNSPQDLMDINIVAGRIGREWIMPHQWKGCVPKAIHQPRILAKLTDAERALVELVHPPSLVHNAVDAVGIGLFTLGRLGVDGETKSAVLSKKKRGRR